jgi:hypothetical protein
LFHKANGYTYEAEKMVLNPKTGKHAKVKITEHVPPDTASMIYWLNNRDPGNWSQRRDVNVNAKVVTAAITRDMTPQQAAEAFAATILGAEVVGLDDESEPAGGYGLRPSGQKRP